LLLFYRRTAALTRAGAGITRVKNEAIKKMKPLNLRSRNVRSVESPKPWRIHAAHAMVSPKRLQTHRPPRKFAATQ
jgi:hypothetical protein